MLTKEMYENATFKWCGEIDYFEIFKCVLVTPVTVTLDILTSPFQIIALIVGKIIEKSK